jgi:hypothetical protein
LFFLLAVIYLIISFEGRRGGVFILKECTIEGAERSIPGGSQQR